jgi:salicylate hydroxylase
MPPCSTTEVAVVGGGIAGLATAAALDRAGIACTVYERAAEPGEFGAGIQISPNGARLLHRLGLADRLHEVAARPVAIELRRWNDNAVLASTPLGDECEAVFGAPYYTLHRADLHRALLDLVGDRVCFGWTAARAVPRGSTVELHRVGGGGVEVDLVIGADGVHSALREAIVADQPRGTGVTVYRGLIPAGRIAEPRVVIWLGPGQHCVAYPTGDFVNVVATVSGDGWRGESRVAPGQVTDLVDAYAGWHPEVVELLGALPAVTRWALHDRAPLDHWYTGRLVLVGDAAHAMLPFGGQGANQAVEDAFALAACLPSKSTVEEALAGYERRRRPRVAQVGAAVGGHRDDHHLPDGDEQRRRDAALAPRRALAEQAWLFGYDAEEIE